MRFLDLPDGMHVCITELSQEITCLWYLSSYWWPLNTAVTAAAARILDTLCRSCHDRPLSWTDSLALQTPYRNIITPTDGQSNDIVTNYGEMPPAGDFNRDRAVIEILIAERYLLSLIHLSIVWHTAATNCATNIM